MKDRCLVTGNLCGTDTWEDGRPCGCLHCLVWMARQVKQLADDEIVWDAMWAGRNLALAVLERYGHDVP